jgi:hypothetical protein
MPNIDFVHAVVLESGILAEWSLLAHKHSNKINVNRLKAAHYNMLLLFLSRNLLS